MKQNHLQFRIGPPVKIEKIFNTSNLFYLYGQKVRNDVYDRHRTPAIIIQSIMLHKRIFRIQGRMGQCR